MTWEGGFGDPNFVKESRAAQQGRVWEGRRVGKLELIELKSRGSNYTSEVFPL